MINRRCSGVNQTFGSERSLFPKKISVIELQESQSHNKMENKAMPKTEDKVYSLTEKIDLLALFSFIISYVIFNSIYFLYFLD